MHLNATVFKCYQQLQQTSTLLAVCIIINLTECALIIPTRPAIWIQTHVNTPNKHSHVNHNANGTGTCYIISVQHFLSSWQIPSSRAPCLRSICTALTYFFSWCFNRSFSLHNVKHKHQIRYSQSPKYSLRRALCCKLLRVFTNNS